MKFRANLRDPRALLMIFTTIRSFSKKALIKLHPQQIRVIAVPGDGFDGAQLWTRCRSESLFTDLRVESRQDNSIYCEIPDVGQMVFALRACERAGGVVIKLAKVDNRQLLTLSMHQASGTGHDTVHEVAIRVLTDTEIARISVPPLEADVAEIYFPPLIEVHAFLDCAKAGMCSSCSVRLYPHTSGGVAGGATGGAVDGLLDPRLVDGTTAPRGGDGSSKPISAALSLVAEGVTSTFETHYGLVTAPAGATLPSEPVEVIVDLKRLCRFLAVRDANPTSVTAHLANHRALVLSAFAGADINLVYYIPAVVR